MEQRITDKWQRGYKLAVVAAGTDEPIENNVEAKEQGSGYRRLVGMRSSSFKQTETAIG